MSPVYDGVNCSAEEAVWFKKFDDNMGPTIERVFSGNEKEMMVWDFERWNMFMRWISRIMKKRILFDPRNVNGDFGEKHPYYKAFEMFDRGMTETFPGQPAPALDPANIAPFLYILFGRGDRALAEFKNYLKFEIRPADGTEIVRQDDPDREARAKAESELRAIGALNGVP
jgi:hypothetical protein